MAYDLANWKQYGPLNRTHIDSFMARWKNYGFHLQSMIMIYQNKWYYPFHSAWNHTQITKDQYEAGITLWVEATQYYFQSASHNIEFPDSFFFLSDQDQGWCGGDRCPMPALAITKRGNGSMELLSPFMVASEHPLYNYPMELKHDKAFFNGRPNWGASTKTFNGTNYWSRAFMANLSMREPDRVHAALIGEQAWFPGGLKSEGDVSLKNHARWKYVMNLDGVTYAGRLSRLMHTDSVLLKEESIWYEFFTRAMKEGVHYLPIFKTGPEDVLDVMREWGNRTLELKRIAWNTQQFARRYLCPRARMLYFRRLLEEYNHMFFSDGVNHMKQFIEDVLVPIIHARAAGDMKKTYMDIVPYDPAHPHGPAR
ncbi:hypothetical protein HYH02_011412 [Chlamydomonas schloesseri]|uniref:Glycosyl transferase CAP10 domain-containing protein n=1 Tax=Chlamydomonas schloesseri TaxID=2026947 RepID=A0A835TDU4_9CHLO|nr:hypothetical protein HYH02_011412 [Chlamydomonas schloesseri]|eukprot:KAG2436980.1 hypothetical protein HYH02_011412 [Chlamydomonas schloesseri]